MLIRIKERKELKEMSCGDYGDYFTQDILEANGAIEYNEATEEDEIEEMKYDWYKEWLAEYAADDKEIETHADELGLDTEDIWERAYDYKEYLEFRHDIAQALLQDVREEYGLHKAMN
jgi:hypothetical protein